MDMCIDNMHLNDPLPVVLFGSEGSTIILPLFLLSYRINMLCHCSSTITKYQVLVIYYDTKWLLYADVI